MTFLPLQWSPQWILNVMVSFCYLRRLKIFTIRIVAESLNKLRNVEKDVVNWEALEDFDSVLQNPGMNRLVTQHANGKDGRIIGPVQNILLRRNISAAKRIGMQKLTRKGVLALAAMAFLRSKNRDSWTSDANISAPALRLRSSESIVLWADGNRKRSSTAAEGRIDQAVLTITRHLTYIC